MNRIKEWAKYKRISNSELAGLAGVSPSSVTDIFKEGVTNSTRTERKYAAAMGIPWEEFVQGPPCKVENGDMTDGERMLEIWKNLPNLPHESLVNIYNAVVSLSRLEESKKNISKIS